MDTQIQSSTSEERPVRSALLLVTLGVGLGLSYNQLGLMAERGLSWISEERTLDTVESVLPSSSGEAGYGEMSDPMGLRGGARSDGLPDLPDLGRPLQMQLPMVKKFFDAEAALIVDAREPAEYAEGHIPGAISLPFEEAITDPVRLESVDPGGRPIILYCGGPPCEVSMKLADELILAGKKKVLVYYGGYPEWVGAGYPVVRGAEPGPGAR